MTLPSSGSNNTRGRVLVVETPSVFREMQSLLLRGAGYEVQCCDDHGTAPKVLANQPFEILILNTDAVSVDSAEYLASVRRIQPAIAIVHVSPSATEDTVSGLTRLGVTTVLQRPVNPRLLVRTLDELMGFSIEPGAPTLHSSIGTGVEEPSTDPVHSHEFRPDDVGSAAVPARGLSDGTGSPAQASTYHFGIGSEVGRNSSPSLQYRFYT